MYEKAAAFLSMDHVTPRARRTGGGQRTGRTSSLMSLPPMGMGPSPPASPAPLRVFFAPLPPGACRQVARSVSHPSDAGQDGRAGGRRRWPVASVAGGLAWLPGV